MSRRAKPSQAEIERALKAAKAAGISVARIEIGTDCKLVLVTGEPEVKADLRTDVNEWDDAI